MVEIIFILADSFIWLRIYWQVEKEYNLKYYKNENDKVRKGGGIKIVAERKYD